MSQNGTIYVGVWTNWSEGAILGSTLTLTGRDGAILVAVLALFIQLSGGQSWSIICFIAHQIRTTTEAKDGIYYQQQATLRNNSSDVGTIWQLAKVAWFWRFHEISSLRKSFSLILTGLFHLLAFGVMSIFSAHITTLGNDVLLARSPSCGIWGEGANLTANHSIQDAAPAYGVDMKSLVQSSQEYVQRCLTEQEILPECNKFKRLQLNWTSTTDAPCPFGNGICLGPANSSLSFDTGLIDSRDDLGINGNDRNRVQYRKIATCSPLKTEGFVFATNSTSSSTGPVLVETGAFYGPNLGIPPEQSGAGGGFTNATYVTTNFLDFQIAYDAQAASRYTV
jgi:hypothetical protein